MQLPPSFEYHNGQHFVAKLKKALYGLKEGGRTWYQALFRALTELGFTHSEHDHGVFFMRSEDGLVILAIHVDNCTITGTSQFLLNTNKALINACYAMTDLGPISWLL